MDDELAIYYQDALSSIKTVNGNTFADIQNTIDLANDGDTIELSGNYYGSGEEIKIEKSLTIVGKNNAVLDAKESSRIFDINSNSILLKNIKFLNADTVNSYNGGAIVDYSKESRIENCEFVNCRAAAMGSGGAIYTKNMDIVNCNFITCYAWGEGAISGGNAINCTFRDCFARKGSGGAMGEGSAKECTFINCSAQYGGALYETSVRDSYFVNCSAKDGGANYRCDVYNCVIMACNDVRYYGPNPFGTTSNCTIISHWTENRYSIKNQNCGDRYTNTFIVNGNSFEDINIALKGTVDGDIVQLMGTYTGDKAIAIYTNELSIQGSATLDAKNKGGIFEVNSEDVTFRQLNFKNTINSAIGGNPCSVYNCKFIDCSGEEGGAVKAGSAYACEFVRCSAGKKGGAMKYGYAYKSSFADCSADYGGAIYEGSAEYSTFKDCSARDGAAIYEGDNVNQCNFTSCRSNLYVIEHGVVKESMFKDCGEYGIGYADAISCTFVNCERAVNDMHNGHKAENCTFINCGDEATIGIIVKYCIFKGNSKPSGSSNVYRHCKITIAQSGTYFRDKTLTVKVIDTDNNIALDDVEVKLSFNNGKNAKLSTDSNGIATCEIPFASGTYGVNAVLDDEKLDCQKTVLNNIEIEKAPSKLSSAEISTVYKAKDVLKVKLINSGNNKALSGINVVVKIYTGKKYTKHTLTTNSNGIASLTVKGLSVANHKVVVSCSDSSVSAKSITTHIKVKKATPVLSTYTFKPSGFFVTIHGKGIVLKDKTTKKPLVGVKVKFKFYTSSKKYKTFTLYTDDNGKCALFTNKYSVGSHNLVVSLSDSAFKVKSKTITYKIYSDEKFTLNNNGYFNVLYTKGGTRIS